MISSYREILSQPGAALFSFAGFVARYPMSLISLSMLMLVNHFYDSYTIAGRVNAAGILGFAIGAPLLAGLVDRYGQAKIMRPSITLSISCLLAAAWTATHQGPVWLLTIFSVGAGFFSGSIGAMVRSRWSAILKQPHQLNTAFAFESALDEIVFMTGPMIATMLVIHIHPSAGIIACALISFFGGLWFFSLKSTEPAASKHAHMNPADKGIIMKSPPLLALACMFFGAGAMLGAVDVAIIEITRELGVPGTAGLQIGIMATGSLLGALVYGSKQWKTPITVIYMWVVIGLALGAGILLLANSQLTLTLAMFASGLAFAPTVTIATTIVQKIVPASRMTEGLTWMNTFMNIGVALGLSVAGQMTDIYRSRGGFIVAAVGGLVMVFLVAATLGLIRKALAVSKRRRRMGLREFIGERRRKSSALKSTTLEATPLETVPLSTSISTPLIAEGGAGAGSSDSVEVAPGAEAEAEVAGAAEAEAGTEPAEAPSANLEEENPDETA